MPGSGELRLDAAAVGAGVDRDRPVVEVAGQHAQGASARLRHGERGRVGVRDDAGLREQVRQPTVGLGERGAGRRGRAVWVRATTDTC